MTDPDDHRVVTDPTFTPGDRVIDGDADDADPMRVLGYGRGPSGKLILAPAYNIGPGKPSVASVNDEEYRHHVVAEVVFEEWLDANVPEPWEEWADGHIFGKRVRSFCREWGVNIDSGLYAYPDGRLEAAPEPDGGDDADLSFESGSDVSDGR